MCRFVLLSAHCLFHKVHAVLYNTGCAGSAERTDQTGALPDAEDPAWNQHQKVYGVHQACGWEASGPGWRAGAGPETVKPYRYRP